MFEGWFSRRLYAGTEMPSRSSEPAVRSRVVQQSVPISSTVFPVNTCLVSPFMLRAPPVVHRPPPRPALTDFFASAAARQVQAAEQERLFYFYCQTSPRPRCTKITKPRRSGSRSSRIFGGNFSLAWTSSTCRRSLTYRWLPRRFLPTLFSPRLRRPPAADRQFLLLQKHGIDFRECFLESPSIDWCCCTWRTRFGRRL